MKIFHCGRCGQLVFFENTRCVNCQSVLAHLPDRGDMGALEPSGDDRWRLVAAGSSPEGQEQGQGQGQGQEYRLCVNYRQEAVCNWAVPADDPNPYCQSCRLTRVIPDLGRPGTRDAWT